MIEFRNLRANELEVRVGRKLNNGKVELLVYKNSRVDMAILDATVGNDNWVVQYKREGETLLCGIGIYCEKHKAFVYKWAAGAETTFEKTKGEQSDALKRAGFVWGVGRSLYSAPKIYVPCDNEYEQFYVQDIGYDDNDKIKDIVIVDSKGSIVFNYRDGRVQKIVDIDPVEILTTVCSKLKVAGEDYKELGKFFNYYKNKLGTFDNVSSKTIMTLWNKWNK